MKITDITKEATGNIWYNKARATLTIISIFIGAFALTLTQSIGTGVNTYINEQIEGFAAPNTINVSRVLDMTQEEFPPQWTSNDTGERPAGDRGIEFLTDEDISTISEVKNVLKVEPLLVSEPEYVAVGETKLGFLNNYTASITTPKLLSGRKLDHTPNAPYEIIIPSSYLEALGFSTPESALGETATIGMLTFLQEEQGTEATIVGVAATSLFGDSLSMNTPLTAETIRISKEGMPEHVLEMMDGYFALTIHHSANLTEAEIETIKADLKEEGYVAATMKDVLGLITQVVDGITAVLMAFSIIALIAASFGIVNTLLMSVTERTREIGLMKAMGASKTKIFTLFSMEAVLIGLLGSALGILASWGVSTAINGITAQVLADLEGLTVSLITIPNITAISVAIMVVAFLAGTAPALRAANMDPIEALRYE